jgi:hypothetical protein
MRASSAMEVTATTPPSLNIPNSCNFKPIIANLSWGSMPPRAIAAAVPIPPTIGRF